MADVGFRDLGFRDLIGSFAQARRTEPTVAPPAREAAPPVEHAPPPQPVVVTPPPPPQPALFGPDRQPSDALGLEPTFARLAELVLHRRTGTPLVVGVLGPAGSGKSFALARIAGLVRDLGKTAAGIATSPFLSRVHVASIDAGDLAGEPASALAQALHASLRGPYPDLAREIAHEARDPHAALREADDKLDEARRRLDGERRALDDAGTRRARLIETVLYETSGSAVDAYARANRAGLERRYAGFGLRGDAIRNYKDYVLAASGSGGRLALALRSLTAFKGQTRLIVLAVLLVAAGIGLGIAIETQESWLASLRGNQQAGAGLATWIEAHIGWLATARSAAFLLAALCILANLWRAFGFLTPVFRGQRLLSGDLDGRRRDLDGLYAHQTKRVDTLEADVERLTRHASEAERRTGGRAEPAPFEPSPGGAARSVLSALSAAMAREPGRGPVAPQRILLAVDHLDSLPSARASDVLDSLRRGAGSGIVALVALDPARHDPAALERAVDVPVRLPALAEPDALVGRLLGRGAAPTAAAKPDAAASALDGSLDSGEADMLAGVAPLAGSTPRALRRFVALYRLARLDGETPRGALAFCLALNLGGTAAEREAVAQGLGSGSRGFALDGSAGTRLRNAQEAVAAYGEPLGEDSLDVAARHAGRYGFG